MFCYHARMEIAAYNPFITVIIPVYNAEKHLRHGLDSLLAQTCGNWEAVCIDDGSKDGSAAVLEEYARRDSRIRVLRQENRGVSEARNRGIQEARGEWVTFMDADDWLSEDMFSSLQGPAAHEGVDMIAFESVVEYEPGMPRDLVQEEFVKLKSEGEFPTTPALAGEMVGTVWAKAFRRSFLLESALKFPKNIRQEDEVFYRESLPLTRSVYLLRHVGYHYFQNRESYMHTVFTPEQSYLLYLQGMEKVLAFYREHRCGLEWEKTVLIFLSDQLNRWYDDFSTRQLRRVRRQNHGFLLRWGFWEKLPGSYMLRYLDHAPWWKDCFVRRQLQVETYHVFGVPIVRRLYPHFQYERSISAWRKLCSLLRGEKHA